MSEPGRDYIDSVIATVRQHRTRNMGSWPSWANALADEVERLREELRLESSADDEIPPGLEGPLDPDYDLNRAELGPSSRPPGCPEC